MTEKQPDPWAQWLKERRHGGNSEQYKRMMPLLEKIRAHVLHNANLQPEDTLLDVGCGDGLIAFGALPLVGEQGCVIFSDISQDLLNLCQERVKQMGMQRRSQFVRASADHLSMIPEQSIDAVTTRSVLIYVLEKQLAFNEFYRVLKPGGRISLFEPINNYAFPEPPDRFYGYNVTPIMPLIAKLRARQDNSRRAGQRNAMMDFNERDLVTYAEKAGFSEIHLTFHIDINWGKEAEHATDQQDRWHVFLHSSPNPLAATRDELIRSILTPEEAAEFTAHLRPLVETNQQVERFAIAYLWAVKAWDRA